MRGEVRISRRIPDLDIDAVQDAGERARTRAQQAFEAAAVLRRLDLARIRRAHRVERRRVDETRLEERNVPVEFEPFDREQRIAQAEPRKPARLVVSLEREVVDGEKSLFPMRERGR